MTSGERMVAAAALHDVGKFSQDEAMVWADALAAVVDDGQHDAPRVLLARVVDQMTAERVRAALLGNLGRRDAVLAERVDELYLSAVDVPAAELPSWADAGIRSPEGLVAFSGHTLDLDLAEAEDGRPWPPITVMVHQVVGAGAGVMLEVGPGGVPCMLIAGQARRIAVALTAAADRRPGRLVRRPDEDRFLAAVGAGLRELRLDRGLSQPRLATRAGVSTSTISNIERGHRPGYNVLFLWRLAGGLGVPVDSVITEAMRDLARQDSTNHLRPGPHLRLAPRRR